MDLSPLWISLKVSATATAAVFLAGIFAAWLVVRINRGKIIIDGLFTLPMVLPPTVLGFILLLIFGRNGTVGRFLQSIGSRRRRCRFPDDVPVGAGGFRTA